MKNYSFLKYDWEAESFNSNVFFDCFLFCSLSSLKLSFTALDVL